eukprot:4228703-Ditylum_brightwellii.AAC.1
MGIGVLGQIGMQYTAVAYFCNRVIVWVVYPCLPVGVLSKKGGGRVDDASSLTLVGVETTIKA